MSSDGTTLAVAGIGNSQPLLMDINPINGTLNKFISLDFVYGTQNSKHESYANGCFLNLTKSDNERRHCLKYALGLRARDATINIPPEFDQPESFIPSWGPKVSHDILFLQNE